MIKWIVILAVSVVLVALSFRLLKNNVPQPTKTETGYEVYRSPTHGFTLEYPKVWNIRKDTQVFENGDAVAFGTSGPTQKENTELTDGVQVAISKPFSIGKDLETWAKEYYDRYAEFSKTSINGQTFEKVYECSRIGCMTYYYTAINGQVYGVAVFAQGQDKMVYDNAVVYILKSLQFNVITNGNVTIDQAIAKVKALPEAVDYLKRVPNGLVAVNGDEDNTYLIQVYEIKDGHTATFNWYKVDKTTGEITVQ